MYDVIIIGGGPGGYVAAIKGAQLGLKVALIEKETVGGICLNHGCIPTKTYLNSAKVYKTAKQSSDFGINIEGVSFDWGKILQRKNAVVKQLTQGVAFLLKKNKVDVYNGLAEVLSKNKISVNDQILETKNLIIGTGASAIIPNIDGLAEQYKKGNVLTYKEILNIDSVPESLVIIGGGVIGVEFATIFNAFGTKVTIIEMDNNILPSMDDDVRLAYSRRLKADGIDLIVNAKVTKVSKGKVQYTLNDEEGTISADVILCAVGTKANISGLEKLNLNIDNGNIVTNEYMQTNIENVYAIGDVNGKYMLAHVASHEGIVAVSNIAGRQETMKYNTIPACVYGSPEIASVGKTEKQVKELGLSYKVSKIPLQAIGKAITDGAKEGFIKLIVEEKHLEILGAHIYAPNATELISQIGLAMTNELTPVEIVNTVHPHPTLSELTLEAALQAIDKAIHI